MINLDWPFNVNRDPRGTPRASATEAARPPPDAQDPAEAPGTDGGPASSPPSDYVSAAEAMRLLDIRAQTLYAYVSRGWVRSVRQPGRRDRLYLRADIERVRARSLARAGHAAVAASAMNWGEPIIPTSITEITPDGPRYRGRGALELARAGATFEAAAELLWTGQWHDGTVTWPVALAPPGVRRAGQVGPPPRGGGALLERFALVTLELGLARGAVSERVRSGRTLDAARQLVQVLVGCFGFASARRAFVPMRGGQSVVDGLVEALGIDADEQSRAALQALLVLLADHELSPGAFSARLAASSGAALHGCIAAALCASSGAQVAQVYDCVGELLAGAVAADALLARAQALQQAGRAIPGFTHPLYPMGDPRATALLELAQRLPRRSARLAEICRFIDAARIRFGVHPRQELAVVVLATALRLPASVPAALFALARTAGWVAHVLEQRLSTQLLRPRARFVER